MIEVYPNLFVGNETDAYATLNKTGWYIIHACKEPFHREALGYTGKAAPKNHPEYLIARRENRLILNLIDAADPAYIPQEIINEAVDAIHLNISELKVLVHCNQGLSRSPTIAMLYLLKYTKALSSENQKTAVDEFMKLYPPYLPANGVSMFVEQNWHVYTQSRSEPS